MSTLSYLTAAGIHAEAIGDNLKLKGLSRLTNDQKNQIVEYAKNHKQEIINAVLQSNIPGNCESCPASGYWDYANYSNQGLLCFHYAYYLGKSGRPKSCSIVRNKCPRRGSMNQWHEDELQRKELVENGYTIVINLHRDNNLIEWVRENGKYIYIGRSTSKPKWIVRNNGFNYGNPFKNGSRDSMCERFLEYFRCNKDMQNHLPELKGKALLCFCYPKRCHGEILAAAANALGRDIPLLKQKIYR